MTGCMAVTLLCVMMSKTGKEGLLLAVVDEGIESLASGFHMVVSHHVGGGNQTQVGWKSALTTAPSFHLHKEAYVYGIVLSTRTGLYWVLSTIHV